MQHHAIAARTWDREFDATAAESPSQETVALFSLLGLVASAAVLLMSSAQTVAAVTSALTQ
jgi:CHASE1-domain containing sensor protein